MKQLKVSFNNNAGVELTGLLDLPGDEEPIGWAIFAHCFTCTKDLTSAVNICRALTSRHIAVLRFDFTGLGESKGNFSDTTFSTQVADLVAAARFMEHEYHAPQILIGHSLGGAVVLRGAKEIPTVAAVVTIGSLFDPAHLIRHLGKEEEELNAKGQVKVEIANRSYILNQAFFDDLRQQAQAPEQTIAALKGALLVMHSPRDMTVGIGQAARIYQAAHHPKSFISLDPADHLLSRKEDSLYAGEMIATWARRYLDTKDNTEKRPEIIDNRVTAKTGHEGFFTELFVNGHNLIADEPERFGGTNRGPSPYDYLLAALGACTTMTMQMYARQKNWPLDAALVRLRHTKIHAHDCQGCAENQQMIDRFERELELIGELSDEQRQRLLEISEKCPVHRTLENEVVVETTMRKKEEKKDKIRQNFPKTL